MNLIPHGRPVITAEDVNAVTEVMKSRFIGRGPKTVELERLLTKTIGQNTVCTGSGRAAIMFALEPFKGRTVYLPTYSTHDLLDAARWAGCNIRLYDYGESGEDLMMVVHGQPTEVPLGTYAVFDFANVFPQNFDLKHHTAVFSFGPMKPITGGHGGALSRAGWTDRNKVENISPMTDINSALVLSQLKRPQRQKRLITVEDFEEAEKAFFKEEIIIRHETGWLLHRFLGMGDEKFPKAVNRWNTTVSVPNWDLSEEERQRVDDACRRYSV